MPQHITIKNITMITIKFLIFFTFIVLASSKSVKQTIEAKAELEAYIAAAKEKVNPRYRPTYHIAAPVGWINDPNGFTFFNGQYHLFYQYYPYDSVWGPMHWGHVVSIDLVNWVYMPTALIPEEEMCFSGSAIEHEGKLYLMYTGRINGEGDLFNETQYLAYSEDGADFTKYEGNPVIASAPDGVPDFRDPKVWKHGDFFYVILGSQTLDGRGRFLLYRSVNLINWEYLSVLVESKGDMGYMWECPDLFELNGKHVILWSPQGVEPQGDRYKNLYQTGYIVGQLNYETFEFTVEQEFRELDFGHDFYATQTLEKDGRTVLVAWFAMWESPHPEEEDGWANTMTIFRELTLDEDNNILMKPVDEMLTLRSNSVANGLFSNQEVIKFEKAAEILLQGDMEKDITLLFEGEEGGEHVWLKWNAQTRKVSVEKWEEDVRTVEWMPKSSRQWRIFLDTSSLELFCGGGEVVFSSRVYPLGGWRMTNLSKQDLEVEAYALKRSVTV